MWKSGEITAFNTMELSGMTKTTFYRKVKEYENMLLPNISHHSVD